MHEDMTSKGINFIIGVLQAFCSSQDSVNSENIASVVDHLRKLKETEITPLDTLFMSRITELIEKQKNITGGIRWLDRLFIAEGVCFWLFFAMHLVTTLKIKFDSVLRFFMLLPHIAIFTVVTTGSFISIYEKTSRRTRDFIAFLINMAVFYFITPLSESSYNYFSFLVTVTPLYILIFWRDIRARFRINKQIAAVCLSYQFQISRNSEAV